jgi:hypothetical protein
MSVRAFRHRTVLGAATAALAATSLAGCSDGVSEDAADPGPDSTSTVDETQASDDGSPEAMTFEAISDDLGSMVDDDVRVRARVEDVITPGVFLINAVEGNDLESVVVVGEDTARDLALDEQVVVEGTVEPSLAPHRVARLLGVQIDDEMLTDFRGDPYLVAVDVMSTDA